MSLVDWAMTTGEGWAQPPCVVAAVIVLCLLCVYPAWLTREG